MDLGRHEEAIKVAWEALRLLPSWPDSYLTLAEAHYQVVAQRSLLRERLGPLFDPEGYSEHYVTGGSKPEDMVEDPIAVGDALPRCAFLLRGIRAQVAA
jgi:hypothetical protein